MSEENQSAAVSNFDAPQSSTNNAATQKRVSNKNAKEKRNKNKKPAKSVSDSRVDVAARQNEANLQPAEEPEEEELELKYGASHVIHLFVPVSVCMALVILTMSTIGYYSRDDGVYLMYTPFTKPTESKSELFFMSIGNALTMLAFVVVMTCVLIVLYKFRFYKVIHGWLILSSLLLLSMFTIMYLQELFKNYNIPIDYLTLAFIIWNYGCLGMICIHWRGPLLLQQGYLIVMSALMALIFIKYLPEWSVWTVLAVISVWDLVAVLCPKGPLRILVETAQERNEPIFPALIYSSGVLYLYFLLTEPGDVASPQVDASGGQELTHSQPTDSSTRASSSRAATSTRYAPLRGKKAAPDNGEENRSNNHLILNDELGESRHARQVPPARRSRSATGVPSIQNSEIEERGVKLGLGDFIFYSVLVGKASSFGDWNTTIACYVAILVGLAFTLMLLALFRKALPALPISIFGGIVFYFATRELMTPFTSELSIRQYLL